MKGNGSPVGNVRLGRRFTDAEKNDPTFIASCASMSMVTYAQWTKKVRIWNQMKQVARNS